MDDYLYGLNNDNIKDISKLRNNKYIRLEINLRHPYDYNVVILKINKIFCITYRKMQITKNRRNC